MRARIFKVLTDAMRSQDLHDALATMLDAASGPCGVPPIATGLLSLYHTVEATRNSIYRQKIIEFLSPISEVDENARYEFFEELEADKPKFRRFQVSVFTLVDTCDDIEKAAIMGRVMKRVLQREISLDIAVRICSMVNRSYAEDLYALKESPRKGIWRVIDQTGILKETYVTSNLESVGFIRFAGVDGGEVGKDNGSIMYQLEELGALLIKYGLSEEPYCWNRFWTD